MYTDLFRFAGYLAALRSQANMDTVETCLENGSQSPIVPNIIGNRLVLPRGFCVLFAILLFLVSTLV